jgi:hypothetical protein
MQLRAEEGRSMSCVEEQQWQIDGALHVAFTLIRIVIKLTYKYMNFLENKTFIELSLVSIKKESLENRERWAERLLRARSNTSND